MPKNKKCTLPFLKGVLPFAIALAFLTTAFLSFAVAGEEPEGLMDVKLSAKPAKLAKDVEASLDHVFDVLKKDVAFEPAKAQAMFAFIDATRDPKDIEPAKRFDGRGICLRGAVGSSLDSILRYFYNPAIPNYLLCPAVLRMSGWHEGSEILARDRGLWDELPELDQPVQVRGREYEATTPDAFAEAYYLYDLNRLMILLKHEGRNVLISVTEQEDKSDVGRKGAILDDLQWDYFYSGLEGLNKGMIGWMDTFTYSSGSVQVYIENAEQTETTVFLFKWLRAGWAGMNVVKRSHIYDGTLRYIRSFAKVVESDAMSPEQMEEAMSVVRDYSDAEVNSLIDEYSNNFEARFRDDPKLKSKDYAKIIADGGYAKVLDAKARRSILGLEMLKALLGMKTLVTLGDVPSSRPVALTAEMVAPVDDAASLVEPDAVGEALSEAVPAPEAGQLEAVPES